MHSFSASARQDKGLRFVSDKNCTVEPKSTFNYRYTGCYLKTPSLLSLSQQAKKKNKLY